MDIKDRNRKLDYTKHILIFLICIVMFCAASAQTLNDFGTTAKTSHDPENSHNSKDYKERRLTHWIKNDSKGLLIGNTCMDEVTHKMGFEYVVQVKGQPGNRNEFGRFFHNIGAKTIILFRNGPFWKLKLKKKRRDCRRLTGDYLG